MKRRTFLYTATGVVTALATSFPGTEQRLQAQTSEALSIQWLGHTCFWFQGGGLKVLVNPFRPAGCTAGYPAPKVETELILISSRLLDEGSIDGFVGNPALLYEPGIYQFNGYQIQGIRTEKDRNRGRQFGTNVAWLWTQAGIKILHLGGLAGPINAEHRILIGKPDVLLVPVGGGPKAYTPQEAKAVVTLLNPKVIIPMHYRTMAADETACDLVPVDEFLALMSGMTVQTGGSQVILTPGTLPAEGTIVQVLQSPPLA